jgi:hypothetical protein
LPGKGSPFSLEYAYTPTESLITIEMVELMIAGSDPLGIPALRELSRYPSIYNESAVYLGEFDFLVRRTITNLPFLSVWNEQVEEQARGPSVDNINRLFVSFCEPVNSSKAFVEGEIRSSTLRGAHAVFDVMAGAAVSQIVHHRAWIRGTIAMSTITKSNRSQRSCECTAGFVVRTSSGPFVHRRSCSREARAAGGGARIN